MAKSLNKVMIIGRLGADPEMRFTSQGTQVTHFSVATNRTWKDQDGNQHEETEWFRIVAWDKLGEVCNTYLTRGTQVYVEGRLQTRKWTDKEGVDRYTTEVIAQELMMLSSPNGNGQHDDEPDDTEEEATPTQRSRRTQTKTKRSRKDEAFVI